MDRARDRLQEPQGGRGWITLFVDNLPDGVSHSWLGNLFNEYGVVKDIYLPVKRSKVTGRHFGFIRYNCSVSADIAVAKTNGMIKGRCQRKGTSFVDLSDLGELQTNNRFPAANGKSFADIVKGDSNLLEKEGTRDEIRTTFVEDIQIRAMGGRSILLTFSDSKVRDEILKDSLMNRWFDNVHPWKGEAASLERFVWLRCRGMPLEAWNLDSFKRIGELWGHFMAIDVATLSCSSFEIGRLLIATSSDAKIDVRIQVELKGVSYSVKVVEQDCDVQIQRPKGTNEEGEDSQVGPLQSEKIFYSKNGILVSNADEKTKVDDLCGQLTSTPVVGLKMMF
ncbi:hypothetical protein Vadar_014743 [Vaccinium darrowii]|uniref:Uncharacterized protein n=1 Tax=Vaccinium darrowii TaxID=229202 RepID=A0ACB7XZQ4_9ERIC|nr:hypothetical protein Vadar_014743 [Vaccinium darrowii]